MEFKKIIKKFTKSKESVLVVGGRGWIGTHLVPELKKKYYITVLDLKDDNDFLYEPLQRYDAIIFLAVDMARTKEAYEYNKKLYTQLELYRYSYPDTRIVYTSSAAVYPDKQRRMKETSTTKPVNYYGKAKLLGENYTKRFKYHAILRLSNVYGLGGKGVVDLFKQGKRTIFGDGTQVRDYIDVQIVCEAITKALEFPKKWEGITNVSSGMSLSTKRVFEIFGQGNPLYKPARTGDVQYSVLDNTRLKKLL